MDSHWTNLDIWGLKEAICNGKYIKLIEIHNKLRIYKVGLHEEKQRKKQLTTELWTEKFPELVQGWKILQFYPARLKTLVGSLSHNKKLQKGNALVIRLNLPYWKGYSKPTQTKLKNKPPKDQTDLQLNWQ